MSSRSPRSREIRVGLVMYGGVSLAIYINGVAAEFFDAVRGRGIYKLLKALTDSDIIVDVVSGTSAGGINGVLLSYALCNELDFHKTADLWREAGDLQKLLRPVSQRTANSVLDSEQYYQPKLEGAFTDMPRAGGSEEDVSGFDELDLFVTGTDVDGDIYTVLDDAGHAIDVKDHRRVFVLKHRHGRREPFKPASLLSGQPDAVQQALAKLCRITSCFPVAFAPPVVGNAKDQDAVDARLRAWGRLPERACAFLDGGLLDNKPFTYTIREIFHRLADRRVDRKLFYVEPDPEVHAQGGDATPPDVVQAAAAALVGIPGYESIAEDLKLVAERNTTIKTYQRIAAAVEGLTQRGGAAPAAPVYRSLRLLTLCQRAVQGVLKQDGHHARLTPESTQRAEALYQSFDQPDPNVWARDEAGILRDYDVYYVMRRLFKVIYAYYDHTVGYQEPGGMARAPRDEMFAIDVLASLNRFMGEVEIIRSAMEGVLDGTDFGWRELPPAEVWKRVDATLITLLDTKSGPLAAVVPLLRTATQPVEPPVPSEAALDRLNAALDAHGTALCRIPGGVRFPTSANGHEAIERYFDDRYCSILRDTVQRLDAYVDHLVRTHDGRPGVAQLALAYGGFEAMDAQLYPLQYAARIDEQDLIEMVRISPRDAQSGFSRRAPEEKVCGDEVHHFSGFLKRSWRSNDILWGRLDGLCQLIETFLRPERIAADPATLERIAEDLHPDRLFPHTSAPGRAELTQWLNALCNPGDPEHARALGRDFARRREELIEAAQLEILYGAVPDVIRDDLIEQHEWNQFKSTDGFLTGSDKTGSLVAAAAAEQLARQQIEEIENDKTGTAPVGRFFRSRYKVGTETVTEQIPPLVLIELTAKALLVTRNALFTALDRHAPGVRDRLVLRLIGGALWLVYRGARWMRRSGCGARVIAAVVLVLTVVVLAYYWHHAGPACDAARYGRLAGAICGADGRHEWGVIAASAVLAMLSAWIVLAWLKRAAHKVLRRFARR